VSWSCELVLPTGDSSYGKPLATSNGLSSINEFQHPTSNIQHPTISPFFITTAMAAYHENVVVFFGNLLLTFMLVGISLLALLYIHAMQDMILHVTAC
jgi:hypothetical protein